MLKISNISKRLGDFSLSDINMNIEQGDYYVLLGRSGSGKTQLLELIAGLVTADSGTIHLDGINISCLKPQHRNVGMVFQDFAVFPHMTTYDNIAYPLRIARLEQSDIDQRVSAIAEMMNITPILHRQTTNLSGGELQRTAIARTLITEPRLLLLDEPLASIDASLKDDITRLLRSINRAGQTIIHVTHDYSETIGLASKVGVIHNGRIIQTGTPDEVFSHPVNRFVARYTGIKNFFRVKFITGSNTVKAKTEGGLELTLSGKDYPESGMLVIRSNNIKLTVSAHATKSQNSFLAKVVEIVTTPAGFDLELDAGDQLFASLPAGDALLTELKAGTVVSVIMDPSDLVWLRGN